jgi:hypothetical protein
MEMCTRMAKSDAQRLVSSSSSPGRSRGGHGDGNGCALLLAVRQDQHAQPGGSFVEQQERFRLAFPVIVDDVLSGSGAKRM